MPVRANVTMETELIATELVVWEGILVFGEGVEGVEGIGAS